MKGPEQTEVSQIWNIITANSIGLLFSSKLPE